MKNQGTFLAAALASILAAGARMQHQAMARVTIPGPAIPRIRESKAWPKQYDIRAGGTRQGERIAKQIERNRLAGKPHPFAPSGQAYDNR